LSDKEVHALNTVLPLVVLALVPENAIEVGDIKFYPTALAVGVAQDGIPLATVKTCPAVPIPKRVFVLAVADE
jgi:hypothetical protein